MNSVTILLIAIIAAALILSMAVLFKIKALIRKQREMASRTAEIVPFAWSILQIQRMIPPGVVLPAWNHWSLPPDTLHLISQHILERRPAQVVEFGAGVSTVLIASLIREYGGKLVTIEHDAHYADKKRAEVKLAGLSDVVDIRVAPIKDGCRTPFGLPWYSIASIEDLDGIDMVLVDGPPKAFGSKVRYPGIAEMLGKLAPSGRIYCDDSNRPGEMEIKTEILRRFPNVVAEELPVSRGCMVFQLSGGGADAG